MSVGGISRHDVLIGGHPLVDEVECFAPCFQQFAELLHDRETIAIQLRLTAAIHFRYQLPESGSFHERFEVLQLPAGDTRHLRVRQDRLVNHRHIKGGRKLVAADSP